MLTCTASGGGSMAYTYMWLKDDSVVSGRNSSTYYFSPLKVTDSGRYSCRVRVGSTTMTTSRVAITVICELDSRILFHVYRSIHIPLFRTDNRTIDTHYIV